jgi:parallel beta-helix repeat protein
VVTNCILRGNVALRVSEALVRGGGGVYGGTLYNCTLDGNSTLRYWVDGGGAFGSTLYNCTLTNNSSEESGGGAAGCTLYNCTLTRNSAAVDGGGASGCTLYNCTVVGNSGGGAYGTLYNCLITGNAGESGGALYGCTVVGNDGGVWGTVFNSIIYYNTGGNYNEWTVLNYCLSTPLPTNGVGNIDADPLFINLVAGDFRLRPDSPCIDAGTNLTDLLTTDLIGLPRVMDGNNDGVARVDMGAHEFNPYRFEPALQLSPDGFQFTVRGEPGKNVRIERSSDLVNWDFAGQVPIPAGGQTLIDPAATSEPFLFYRAVSVP